MNAWNAAYLNTRDIGGIPVAGGLRTAEGVIYRTAALKSRIPASVEGGLVALGEERRGSPLGDSTGIRPVHFFDLRSAGEWEGEAVGRRDDVVLHHHPLVDPDGHRVRPEDRGPAYFAEQYVRMIPAAGAILGRLLTVVADDAGPVVVGCRLGKDRTGLVVLLLLHVLGASDGPNTQEFLRTGSALASRPDWLAEYASQRGETAAQVLRRCQLPPSVPQHVLDVLHRRAPLMADAEQLLGINAAVLRRARTRLTESRGEDK
ncbi:tyrosine-protein phosphatase [Streptomyces sp. NPDC050658]|uniref:tyrosine-protein phosphatase n=1 Tax=unclassified Streptomyces TaxID=2593676 RepID=UPI003414FC3F